MVPSETRVHTQRVVNGAVTFAGARPFCEFWFKICPQIQFEDVFTIITFIR